MPSTKYRSRLSPAETGMYDLMHRTSVLLEQLAQEVAADVDEKLSSNEDMKKLEELLHDVVTYAFTLGVQFAVKRQQEVETQVTQQMGLVRDPRKVN